MEVTPVRDDVMQCQEHSLATRGLYGLLCVMTKQRPRITAHELAIEAGCDRRTLDTYLTRLAQTGAVSMHRFGARGSNIWVCTELPGHAAMLAQKEMVNKRLALARRRAEESGGRESIGESLMREWLNLIIASQAFTDNARPGFLINPTTQERLEYDRWYPDPKVAFEFHGPQHFGFTTSFSNSDDSKAQRLRDLVKIGQSHRHQITLVEVQAKDLKFETMQLLIPPALPRRALNGYEPIIQLLERKSASYRQRGLDP